jgi:hypothetical protein
LVEHNLPLTLLDDDRAVMGILFREQHDCSRAAGT